jgi:uncharacterized protein YbbC (DUF1343 family)
MVVKLKILVAFLVIFQIVHFACGQKKSVDSPGEITVADTLEQAAEQAQQNPQPLCGADRTSVYLPILQGKRIGMVVNHTSVIGATHLVDSLLKLGLDIQKIYAPEHGFRGTADAGETVKNGKDQRTGLPIVSLYGSHKKPTENDLAGVDLVLFDIQDVGARFYTYISTMSYVMEACAEQKLPFIVLDRPNPNGHFVDGPVLEKAFSSFVGLHEIPVVHGMTVGEYAQMVNGEDWLANGRKCDLTVVPCQHYDHTTFYQLPIQPSPNLPNMHAIYLYPSLCFFEGTNVSVGRGTDKQFQVYGAPGFPAGNFAFTPVPKDGAKNPPFEGQLCKGYDLSELEIGELQRSNRLNLSYLLDFYRDFPNKGDFFLKNLFFDKLAGNSALRQQITAGKSEAEIRESWNTRLGNFKKTRKKYLLYKDFE